MECPLCFSMCADAALVCAACGRDIGVPPELLVERDELRAKRAVLKADLAAAEARLARRRRR